MKIVFDTNVLVAGVLTPFGPCGEIIRMILSGALALCVDARILAEYDEVLRRPRFEFDANRISALIDFIQSRGQLVAADPALGTLPDPDDKPFLEVAIAGTVECLVTGNRRHFPASLCKNVRVFNPTAFLSYYKSRQ